jgi:hypothetical protein
MRKIILLVCVFCLYNIHAQEVLITENNIESNIENNTKNNTETHLSIEFYLGMEYCQINNFYSDISTIGTIELNENLTLKAGFSAGRAKDISDLNFFTNISFGNITFWLPVIQPIVLSLSYLYNGLPEYETHSHTIHPVISYNTSRIGGSIGAGFRFTSFFNEPAFFEPLLSFYGYVNIINNEKLCLGLGLGNFNYFQVRNLMALSFEINSIIHINNQWSVINDIEIKHSGSDGLAANFYGINWHGGARFSW